jgi:hypothetical protein
MMEVMAKVALSAVALACTVGVLLATAYVVVEFFREVRRK